MSGFSFGFDFVLGALAAMGLLSIFFVFVVGFVGMIVRLAARLSR